MRTQTYQEKLVAKNEVLAKFVEAVHAAQYAKAEVIAAKAEGKDFTELKAVYKAAVEVRKTIEPELIQLIQLNKELKAFRVTDEDRAKVEKTERQRVKVVDMTGLKNHLDKKHVKFINRGFLIEVADKKVSFSHGKFYVNKQAVEPSKILKAL
jgi:predicted  nucleic acid-binding Zn-ribbon protein